VRPDAPIKREHFDAEAERSEDLHFTEVKNRSIHFVALAGAIPPRGCPTEKKVSQRGDLAR